jgi:predicted metal-dependent hydrolase
MQRDAPTTGRVRHRDISVRRVEPPLYRDIPRHFVADDLVMSHLVAVLSAMFPSGEDFFVRSVRSCRDQLATAELREDVNRFVGQESMHGRLHRSLNAHLDEMGFKVGLIDHTVDLGFNRLATKLLPQRVQLAVTTALEHYTATIAEVLLDDPQAQAMFTDDDISHLLLWHALEESEHKAVAFDVYRAVGGNRLQRAAVMYAVTAVFVGGLMLGTAYSVANDPSIRDVSLVVKSLSQLPRWPFFSSAVGRRLLSYLRRDFHPDDIDSSLLLERWRNELFGPNGVLTQHPRT